MATDANWGAKGASMTAEERNRYYDWLQSGAGGAVQTQHDLLETTFRDLGPEFFSQRYPGQVARTVNVGGGGINADAGNADRGSTNLGDMVNGTVGAPSWHSKQGLSDESHAAYMSWLKTKGRGEDPQRFAYTETTAPTAAYTTGQTVAANNSMVQAQPKQVARSVQSTISAQRQAEAKGAGLDLASLTPQELAAFSKGGLSALEQLRWTSEASRRPANPNLMA